ncbi:MAG: beta-galactosidase [Bacteroidales bacterium]|nr:beta-galactosidase [Bacteroidales bacterium]
MKRFTVYGLILLIAIGGMACQNNTPQHTFKIGKEHFLLDDQPFQVRCGEMHFARVPKEYWRHRIQMVKALGMNSVCAYLFWNFHERTPGKFTWKDEADIAEFCKIAQEEGMWVILRPGPYTCAEWEMGGLPWWLLKNDSIKLRTKDPLYIEACRKYLKEVGKVLAPLQVTQGGPILMVQVENEYGFYADDAEYMGVMRDAIVDAGFDVPLFACNPTYHLKKGFRDDIFQVVNFGSNPEKAFKKLRELQPEGPLMCGEFYSGWFDTWGNPHNYGQIDRYLKDMEYMLKEGASFSVYMAHGGTTFGFWAGADRPFKPDVSSYDYGAPITEAGWTNEKFYKTRELVSKYLMPGEEPLPEPPPHKSMTSFEEVKIEQCAPLFDNLPKGMETSNPRTMEYYDQSRGSILYRTKLPAGKKCKFIADAVHDFAWVFVDGEKVDVMDRRRRNFKVDIPAREKEVTVDVLVHAMGRINFGPEVHDRKGLHAPLKFVGIDDSEVEKLEWEVFNLDYNDEYLQNLTYKQTTNENKPGIWKGEFKIVDIGDVFIDMSKWGKGVVWVNGHCLGRFCNIGPVQTMYVPAPWLIEGVNKIEILDLVGPRESVIAGLREPILNELHPELDFSSSRRAKVKLMTDKMKAVKKGSFEDGDKMQSVEFKKPVSGRYFCLKALDSHNEKPFAAIAELDIYNEQGKSISHQNWTIAYVSSEEIIKGNGAAENAIDGQTFNFWHTEWGGDRPGYPHYLVIDMGKKETVTGFQYVPRSGKNVDGRIKKYEIFVGDEIIRKE